MAYSFSFTSEKVIIRGIGHLKIVLTETEVGTSSEATITGLPRYGTITRYISTLTPVNATEIDPLIGRSSGFTEDGQDEVAHNLTPAEHIDNADPVQYFSDDGTLYIRNQPDVAGDDIDTEFLIRAGWE